MSDVLHRFDLDRVACIGGTEARIPWVDDRLATLYPCHANGHKAQINGRRIHLHNAYLCKNGSGESMGVVYPDGSGSWYGDNASIRCPVGTTDAAADDDGEAQIVTVAGPVLFLAVQVEFLRDIDERGAQAERVTPLPAGRGKPSYVAGFQRAWDEMAPPGLRWVDNPMVWRLFIRREDAP